MRQVKRAGHENKAEKKRGSITCRTDRANEANKMFIIYSEKGTKSFDVLTGDQELEVCTATYRPNIDQSQQSVSHIIVTVMFMNILRLLRTFEA